MADGLLGERYVLGLRPDRLVLGDCDFQVLPVVVGHSGDMANPVGSPVEKTSRQFQMIYKPVGNPAGTISLHIAPG